MTGSVVRVQRVVMPSGTESFTVVTDGDVVDPVDRFLAHLTAIERSPNTARAYAHDLRDYVEFLAHRVVAWDRVELEELGQFVVWLRLPEQARVGGVAALPSAATNLAAATVNRKLSALASFYEFHQRHGVELGELFDPVAARPPWWVVAAVPGALGRASGTAPRDRAAHRSATTARADRGRDNDADRRV